MSRDCRHKELILAKAVSYCCLLSGTFVLSLYVVPARIRSLPRDDARQIRWRSLLTSVVCTGSLASYPIFFCADGTDGVFDMPSIFDIRRDSKAAVGVLAQTAILYVGSLLQMTLELCAVLKQDDCLSLRNFLIKGYYAYIAPTFRSILSPYNDADRWIRLRNIVIAPLAEEIVFRACMIPALCSTGLSIMTVVVLAPLFFGVSHAHHAILRIHKGERPSSVLFKTVFQFGYTSLFGTYASYAYLRTGSLVAVALCHSFCNVMGLPNLSFLNIISRLHPIRTWLLSVHVIGVLAFALSFRYTRFLSTNSAGFSD